jgi:ABC-type transporter Mla subunit MlaD
MDDLIVKLNEKLDSAVKKLRDGNYDDHDILPALLWVLLEYNRSHRDDLEQVRERTDRTLAEIGGLAKTLQEECEKLRQKTSEDLIKAGDDLGTRIGGLAQTLQEECEKLRHQLGSVADSMGAVLKSLNEDLNKTLQQNALQLQKLVETKVGSLSEVHQSGVLRTDNKLRWILVGSIFQVIFILIVMFLIFGK